MSSRATQPESDPSPTPSDSRSKSKDVSKMHRRSRSGCFTCRLRRKKCDESKPICRACRHLGVDCEYKRPLWWTHPDQRREHKERIKDIIKQTKLQEKPAQQAQTVSASVNTPPSLCHSLPTTDTQSEATPYPGPQTAEDNFFSPPSVFDFNSTPLMAPPHFTPFSTHFPEWSTGPYEIDVQTENTTYVNDIPQRKDSHIATFTTWQQPTPQTSSTPFFPGDQWVRQEYYESKSEMFGEEPLDFTFFEFPHDPLTPSKEATIQVDECDKHLLDHFLEHVAKLFFPILDVNQHSSALKDVILPALTSNKSYLHCCLSIAAIHLKATHGLEGEQIDQDIMRHRIATVSELYAGIERDSEYAQLLEAELAVIFFQSSVGSYDGLLDIPWHQHFTAASEIIGRLNLHASAHGPADVHANPPFNMTLASWIDILGSTVLCRVPVFAAAYREKMESGVPSGLAELMGCDDRVMYLISEIACLESLRSGHGMGDLDLCKHIQHLGESLTETQASPDEIANVYNAATGAIRPKQLSRNITAIYRLAARIHLCTLVPDYDISNPSIVCLVDAITDAMAYIPSGPDGFDRSLVWPLLIAGSASLPSSTFRQVFTERCSALRSAADFGSFGRVKELLFDVWKRSAELAAAGQKRTVHWRDVMQQKNWDFLLI